MTPFDNELADYLEKIGPPQSMYLSPKSMAKKLTFNTNSSSNSTLERKIKKTLIEQGILDIDENDKTPDCLSENESSIVKKDANSLNGANSNNIDKDDEIGNEIKNLQNELKSQIQQQQALLTPNFSYSRSKSVSEILCLIFNPKMNFR